MQIATRTAHAPSSWFQTGATRGPVSAGLALLLLAGAPLLATSTWQSSVELHTLLEVAGCLIALFVATMALVRYHTRPTTTFLFVALAFLGTGLLDGYHAIVTMTFGSALLPSTVEPLIPWSWLASRMFLSAFLLLSYLAWRRREKHGEVAEWAPRPR